MRGFCFSRAICAVGLALLTSVTAQAADVSWADLPAAVAERLFIEVGDVPLGQIAERTVDGRSVYVVEIDGEQGLESVLHVSAEGALLSRLDLIPIEALPVGVNAVLVDEGGQLEGIERFVEGDSARFTLTITHEASAEVTLVVAPNGAILARTENAEE